MLQLFLLKSLQVYLLYPQLQPQQLIRAEQDRNRSYRAVYDLKSKKMTQLATREIPQVTIDPRSSSDVAVGTSQEK